MSRLARARARLAEHYLAGLKTKLESLSVERDELADGRPGAEGKIRRMAHQLRGSGATFGHPQITESAAAVEDAPGDGLAEALDDLIAVLRETSDTSSAVDGASILVVEDDRDLARMLERTLDAPDRFIHTVRTIAEAEANVDAMPVDLMLLDLALPDGDGRNLLASLRDRPQTAAIPIVVMSATAATQTKTECLTLGAEQYLDKPIHPELVAAAVSGILERRRRHAQEVRIDALTGLTNRAGFREEFERAVKLGDRARLPSALAILDIDHFKKLNDTYGHNAGDVVLRKFGEVLTKTLRKTDLPARWGGEEFVVLLQNTDAESALGPLRNLQRVLRATKIEVEGTKLPAVTFSGGVVDVAGNDSLDAAVSRADKLLYDAKRTGRDRVLDDLAEDTGEVATRILVAEDDESMAELVVTSLEEQGFAVSRFADGTSALAAAREDPHALLILDKNMPGLDGFEVLRRVRTDSADSAVPVLMLTAVGREDEIERAFDLGADDYVQKPFRPRELVARVRRLLRP